MHDFIQLNSQSRRDFLRKCAAPAACAACAALCPTAAKAVKMDYPQMPAEKAKLRLVFAHPLPERQGWPYQHYDYEKRKADYLGKLTKSCPNVDFLPVWSKNAEESQKILQGDREVDGYVVYILGIPSDSRPIVHSGRPVLLIDDLYGGTGSFLGAYGDAKRKGMRVAGVSSTDFDDVVKGVRLFEVMKRMACSNLIDVTDRDIGDRARIFKDALGVNVVKMSASELNAAYEKSNRAEAKKWAKMWIDGAEKVIEPSVEEIEKSAGMYLGMNDLMMKNKAQGIAVDCLQMFYGNKMVAYPCLGFFQMLNDGYVGACEADIQSASTMLLVTYMTGRPGYISDPVIDTSKNQIIYAHCVSTSMVYGPQGARNRYEIRSHSEDRKGASVRSIMPVGEMTTSLKFLPESKTVVIHTARTVDNIDEDRACRTKLAAEVPNARKLMADWAHGWHRVTVYGDYRTEIDMLSGLLGFRFVEEG
jgi:hypothetical protein